MWWWCWREGSKADYGWRIIGRQLILEGGGLPVGVDDKLSANEEWSSRNDGKGASEE